MVINNRVFYKNDDYTVSFERIGDCEKYFLKFHGQADSEEYEISLAVFNLYYKEFRKPLDNERNEQRRHIEDGEIDGFIKSSKLAVTEFEQESIDKAVLDAVLKSCTQIQQRRFRLYHFQDFTLKEIAKIESCTEKQIWKSVKAVEEKIKKVF